MKYFLSGIIAILLTIIGFGLTKNLEKLGSVASGSAYTYKLLNSSNASTTAKVPVRGGAGLFGSLAVNSTSSVGFTVYDGNNASSTVIASFPANTPIGTYTFDVSVIQGITVIGGAGFNGNYTITYR